MHRLRTLHLFAGAGGGIFADLLLGHQPVCAVEINEYCQQVLSARQADGILPWFPIFADVTKFDGRPWNGIADIVCGGFPCQDISSGGNSSGGKGAGLDGERSGLWKEMARIISEVQPRYVLVENSPLLVSRGLATVLADLAAMGFDARWGVVGASDVGAPHERKRIWIVGYNTNKSDASGARIAPRKNHCPSQRKATQNQQKGQVWQHELGAVDVAQRFDSYAGAMRVLHGMADRHHRLEAIGNGQVPRVVAEAWRRMTNP
ncbi:DNA cytosine methyltransferase [Giesbergeria sp.]|uniref:DNA cytosine methyltransferase n=1 Tax=Giesbergeria sp. TaxID=2818473 RepID=UPI0034284622